jgi:hypothetical protein
MCGHFSTNGRVSCSCPVYTIRKNAIDDNTARIDKKQSFWQRRHSHGSVTVELQSTSRREGVNLFICCSSHVSEPLIKP